MKNDTKNDTATAADKLAKSEQGEKLDRADYPGVLELGTSKFQPWGAGFAVVVDVDDPNLDAALAAGVAMIGKADGTFTARQVTGIGTLKSGANSWTHGGTTWHKLETKRTAEQLERARNAKAAKTTPAKASKATPAPVAPAAATTNGAAVLATMTPEQLAALSPDIVAMLMGTPAPAAAAPAPAPAPAPAKATPAKATPAKATPAKAASKVTPAPVTPAAATDDIRDLVGG